YVMNRNKLIAYPDFEKSSFRSTMDLGKSLNLRKKLKFLSVDPQTGLYIFEDLNKDGVITSNISNLNDDKYAIDVTPKYNGSFNLDFNYKKFKLSAHFYFIKKYAANIFTNSTYLPGYSQNYSAEVMNR